MKNALFYPRLISLLILAFLLVYVLFSLGKFLYFRQAGLTLLTLPHQAEYTIGTDKPIQQVAVLGDSTAYGVGSSDYTKTYHYQFLSQQSGSFHVKNFGVVGAQVSDLATQLENIQPVDLLFISISGNDVTHLTPLSTLSSQLDQALSLAESKADTVILVTPGSMGDVGLLPWPIQVGLGYRSGQVSTLTKQITAQHDIIHVDLFSHAEASFAQNPKYFFATDLFHPSDAGYGLWATAIQNDVESAGGLGL